MLDNSTITAFYQDIKIELENVLAPYGSLGEVAILGKPKPVADDTTKLLIRNRRGQPVAVILCSSPIAPHAVARSVQRAEQARSQLPSQLGEVIPTLLMQGEYQGLTYVVWPYFKPLSQSFIPFRWQCWYLRPRVLTWLLELTRATHHTPSHRDIETDFAVPLENMLSYPLSQSILAAVTVTLHRLHAGHWTPFYVLAHNDLWAGNLLLSPRQQQTRFMVIDWGSANSKGHAIYDLLRLAHSLKVRRQSLLKELHQHCSVLNCSLADTSAYLLTSFGYLGMHREHFPQERYILLVETFYRLLQDILKENRR